jgi:uncharacterized membrane protein YcjF (UPF0283 family)
MARERRNFKNLKSMTGAALFGLGVLILSRNLAEANARLSDLLGISAEAVGMLGVLIAVGLAPRTSRRPVSSIDRRFCVLSPGYC